MAKGDLSDFYPGISKVAEKSREDRDDWNRSCPPLEEFNFSDEDGDHVVGVWIGTDGILSFSFKMANGKYNPYAMTRVPHAVYNFIRRQDAIK